MPYLASIYGGAVPVRKDSHGRLQAEQSVYRVELEVLDEVVRADQVVTGLLHVSGKPRAWSLEHGTESWRSSFARVVSDHDRQSRVPSEDRFRRDDPPFPPDGGRCPFVTVISRYCLSSFNPRINRTSPCCSPSGCPRFDRERCGILCLPRD